MHSTVWGYICFKFISTHKRFIYIRWENHGEVVCATAVKSRADVAFAFALAAARPVYTDTQQV